MLREEICTQKIIFQNKKHFLKTRDYLLQQIFIEKKNCKECISGKKNVTAGGKSEIQGNQ